MVVPRGRGARPSAAGSTDAECRDRQRYRRDGPGRTSCSARWWPTSSSGFRQTSASLLVTVTARRRRPRPPPRPRVCFASRRTASSEALAEHRVRLQAAIGRQVRLKRTPQLSFVADPAVSSGRPGRGRSSASCRTTMIDRLTTDSTGRSHAIAGARRRSRSRATSAPDGDALGSMLALHHLCRSQRQAVGRVVARAVRGRAALHVPARPRHSPPSRADFPAAPEVMVTFDCGSLDRLGELADAGPGRRRADRARPPRDQRPLRHDQPRRPRRRGHRRRRAPAGQPPRLAAEPRRRRLPLHRARHRHRPVPVLEHHARGVRAGRGAGDVRPADRRR